MPAGRRALIDWLAGGAIGAAVFAWFGHAFLNYDTLYGLVWGSDIAHGRTPDFEVAVAPTPHPLVTGLGVVLAPFGAGAEDIALAIGLLALGMLAVGLFRLGHELFGVWAGLLAAAIIVTRVPILNFGIRGYVDLPTAAFVVWAAVLEVRKPRRGAPVLILLALAGLLRPEAWLYAAAYWAYLGFPRRLLAYAAAAPVIWLVSDLLITGNPLHSLTGTHDLAAELGRKTGITALPEVAPRRLGEILRLPELLAAAAGIVFAVKWARERARLPLTIAALNGVAYTAFAVARLPLLGRYLFVAAAMLTVFAGAGALGWLTATDGKRIWKPVGIAALLAIAVFFPLQQVDRLDLLKDDIAARDRIQADLRELVQRPDVKPQLRACAHVYVPTHRPVPLIALYADLDPTRISAPKGSASGCVVVPASDEVAALAVLDPNEPSTAEGVYINGSPKQNRSWQFAQSATIAGAD